MGISPALIGLKGGINIYAYANNSPLRYVDPEPEGQKIPVRGLSVQLQKQSDLCGVDVDAEAFNNSPDFLLFKNIFLAYQVLS